MTDVVYGRRLMIREMVLDNFKSYAGPQSVGPFHKSFSSVVGPNGSGKSNVIDAMLFVFGRRAKQLRFNKVSELIHNSTNFQNLDTARVTVHFQEIIDKPGEDFEVVPGSEFTVARTAHRNNTSDYYVNGKKATTKEVTDLLKAKGIDLDNNRFLILQGEVEQISMMKPKAEDKNDTGLLEYLEDIIGTHQYVAPIEEASKQLEEMNEKRQSLLQRLKISEKEKDALAGKKDEAELFLAKKADMYQARICGTTIYVTDTQAKLAGLEGQAKELEAKLAYERGKASAHEADAKAAEGQYETADRDMQSAQKALEAAEKEFKGFERRDAKGQIELKDLQDKVKKSTARMEKEAIAAKKAETEAAAIQGDAPAAVERLTGMHEGLVRAEANLEDVREGLRGEVEALHQQLSQVRTELAPWERRVGEATGRIGVATAERDLLARRADDARKRLDGALKALAGAQQASAKQGERIKDLETSTANCRSQIEAHQQELTGSRAAEGKLEAAVAEARERVAGLRAEVQSSGNASGLIVALMTARAKGELTGLYGRLGDLGAIDAKYDVAVSTAVSALDYIVVETTSDAQRCVEYLRKHNLGVATCLILEKQRRLAQQAAEKVKTPEGCPRLYDLINIKDVALRPAFFFACGNTLVTETLDQASRIAYNGGDSRFRRVVTLQGELIAESGTMSGGGGRPQRGRMQLGSSAPRGSGTGAVDAKAAAAELKRAEQALEQAAAALRGARDASDACQKALRAAEKQLGELELAAPKARMEAESEVTKAADIQQRLGDLRAATQVDAGDAARITALSSEVAREEIGVAELRRQSEGLEKKAATLQAKIDHAGGEPLQRAKTSVTKLQKEVADAEADTSKKAVQLKACLKQVEKWTKDHEKDEKEIARLEAEVVKLQAELKDMEDHAFRVMELREGTTQQLVTRKQELEQARTELREVTARHSIIRKTELEIEAALDGMAKIKHEQTKAVAKWQREIEGLHAEVAQLAQGDVPMLDVTQLAGQTADDFMYKASVIEAELVQMNPDLESVALYRAKAADHAARAAALDAATAERDEVRRGYEVLRKSRLDEFMAGFNVISLKLKEMYQMITLGGDAELELVDSLDPFSEGIVFSVRPPKKSWKNISNLSGGEKTLSSLSLVFALHHYKPTPLYVMDEIDAALDFKNVSIVAHYIKERTRNAQFIIISLRNNMFELADRLVGIYKTDNTTKTVTINPSSFAINADPGQGQQAVGGSTPLVTVS